MSCQYHSLGFRFLPECDLNIPLMFCSFICMFCHFIVSSFLYVHDVIQKIVIYYGPFYGDYLLVYFFTIIGDMVSRYGQGLAYIL
jgi:hypothetical protein